jgi:hypothetical protein
MLVCFHRFVCLVIHLFTFGKGNEMYYFLLRISYHAPRHAYALTLSRRRRKCISAIVIHHLACPANYQIYMVELNGATEFSLSVFLGY